MKTNHAPAGWARLLGTAGLLAFSSLTHALQVRQEASRFDAIVLVDPSVVVSPIGVEAESASIPESVRAGWESFKAIHGKGWDITLDARSGAPLLVQGQGIPIIPGSGNTLESAAPVTLDSLAALLQPYVITSAALVPTADSKLELNREASGRLTADLWKVVFDRSAGGVPVAGDRYIFHVGHGNLIAFGATRWSAITTSSIPSVSRAAARAVLSRYMGLGETDELELDEPGSLLYVPIAAAGSELYSSEGIVGAGYETRLAWRFAVVVSGEPGKWTALVDAHTGTVLSLYDSIQYAQVKGGVLPLTGDGICPGGCEQPGFPMPFADIKIGTTTSSAGSMGAFTCAPEGASATTTLVGPYVRVVDTCGSISQTVSCDADLDLKFSIGTDCTVPSGGSAGDTHAARSSFYHLNRIKEHARAWLPSNSWLGLRLTDNVNLNNTCNAFWNDAGASGTVNFYRSGGGCRNTGEIAGVFLHEWGHGLDQNDGGGYDNPSEAYGDVTAFLLTHQSCIGRGFRSTNCGGYGNACLSCTGVRDQDWDLHASHTPQTPENWPASCPGGSGPCGREVHCEAYLAGQTVWDLAVRDLPASGMSAATAWQTTDRLWFASRTGSGGNAYTCGSPATNRSCAVGSWFNDFRTVDDDDGNLANGTPHAAAIYQAFSRHNIPCGNAGDAANQDHTTCPALAAPVVTVGTSFQQIALSWPAVPGASSYNILRNDQGCGWAFTPVANVPGTSFVDTNLPNGFPIYYSVQAVGANAACLGGLSSCTTAVASGPHAAITSTVRVADTCATGGGGDGDSIYDDGEEIQFSVTLKNDGGPVLTGVTATLVPLTPGVTMLQATASYPTINGSASAVSLAPHYRAQLPAGLACGEVVSYEVTIVANEGTWAGALSQTVGLITPGGGTILSEGFSGGIPATWTIVDGGSGGGAAATWTTANPGSRAFAAALPAPVAMVDSDIAGTTATQDEQLITPVLDLSGALTVTLNYDEYFRWRSGGMAERGDVDVSSSLTGGAWVNVLRNQNASNPPLGGGIAAAHRTLDLTEQAAGASDVRLRFRYYSAQHEWWWEIDNVAVTYTDAGTCAVTECDPNASADLEMAQSSPGSALAGQDLAIGWTVTNHGPHTAANVQIGEPTPPGTTFRSLAPPAGWSCGTPAAGATGTIGCSIPSLVAGATADFAVVVRANPCEGDGTTITSTPSASSPTSDPASGNNAATGLTSITDTGACDDENPCTSADLCSQGACVGTPAGPLPEVANVLFSSKTNQQWDGLVGLEPGPVYDVVRGTLGEWPVGSGGSELCRGSGVAATSLELADDPAAETGFWYLVRGRNACGSGTYGTASDGSPRITSACP